MVRTSERKISIWGNMNSCKTSTLFALWKIGDSKKWNVRYKNKSTEDFILSCVDMCEAGTISFTPSHPFSYQEQLSFGISRKDYPIGGMISAVDFAGELTLKISNKENKEVREILNSSDAIIWCFDPFCDDNGIAKDIQGIEDFIKVFFLDNKKIKKHIAFCLTKIDRLKRSKDWSIVAKSIFKEAYGEQALDKINSKFLNSKFFCLSTFGYVKNKSGEIVSNAVESEDGIIILRDNKNILPEGIDHLLRWIMSR